MSEVKKKKPGFITPPFRISYPQLFEAVRGGDDGKGDLEYRCQAVFYPAKFSESEKAIWQKLLKKMDEASMTAHKKPWRKLDPLKKGLRAVSEDGPYSMEKGYGDGTIKEGHVGYPAGAVWVNLSKKAKNGQPGVVLTKIDPDTEKPMIVSEENGNTDEIYSGCWCRASVNIFAYNQKAKGVSLGLNNIQKIKNGERLDTRVKAEDDFDEELDEKWIENDGDDEATDTSGDDGDGDDDL